MLQGGEEIRISESRYFTNWPDFAEAEIIIASTEEVLENAVPFGGA